MFSLRPHANIEHYQILCRAKDLVRCDRHGVRWVPEDPKSAGDEKMAFRVRRAHEDGGAGVVENGVP